MGINIGTRLGHLIAETTPRPKYVKRLDRWAHQPFDRRPRLVKRGRLANRTDVEGLQKISEKRVSDGRA